MGLFDSTDEAQPSGFDAAYGLTADDKKRMLFSSLSQIGGLLMAAGSKQMPGQRGQYLAQLGNVGANMQSDIYKMAQAKLMQAQMMEKQQQIKELDGLRGRMQDVAGFKAAYGFDPTGLSPQLAQQIIQQKTVNSLTNPDQKLLTQMQVEKARRDLETPLTKEIGNDLYQFNPQDKRWEKIVTGAPKGGVENQANQIVTGALKDPSMIGTPDYYMAFNHMYGPKQVQAFNPETKQMEYTWVRPPIPEGLPLPTWSPPGAAQQAQNGAPVAAPAPPAVGAQPMPPPGGASPALISRPPQEEKFTEEQNKAAAFARRMSKSMEILNPLDQSEASRPGLIESAIGGKLGDTYIGFTRDGDRQRYEQAKRDWVTANLRKESGAVIGVDEMNNEIAKYFPMPGDKPEVIEQKRKSREEATMGMLGAAGPAAKRDGISYKPYDPPMKDRILTMPPEDVLSVYQRYKDDPKTLTPEERMALIARLKKLNGGR